MPITSSLLALGLAATTIQQVQPINPVPSARQLAWHKLERYAFVHFGPNTFTGLEWGTGAEKPAEFNPKHLDCRQWVRVLKHAGFKGVIITAKHHDGFCLWPSAYSSHTVKQSEWKGGKGDVLRELSDACKEANFKMGVYLSPWDRNHPTYGTPQYNDTFVGMLSEVLGNYGPIFEVWFDGANGEGPNGKRQVYDWPRFIKTVRKFQPRAVIFSDAGPDIRWVGNEEGYAGETNWAPLRRDEFVPGTEKYKQLTSGHEDGNYWVPTECDVSIRPGWFWRASEDSKVKTVDQLIDIYFGSVGRNGSMLLNVPPDANGLITSFDETRLNEFNAEIKRLFSNKLKTSKGVDSEYLLAKPSEVTIIQLCENIRVGQRIQKFEIEARIADKWSTIASGTTIGAKRLLKVNTGKIDAVRLKVIETKGPVQIKSIDLYGLPKLIR